MNYILNCFWPLACGSGGERQNFSRWLGSPNPTSDEHKAMQVSSDQFTPVGWVTLGTILNPVIVRVYFISQDKDPH